MSALVGILTIPASNNVHREFEYAGAGEIWDIPEQQIEIYKSNGYWFTGKRKGTRRESWFQSRLGASLGSNNRNTTPTEGIYPISMNAGSLGREYHKGNLELSDDWTCEERGFYSEETGKAGDPICFIVPSNK